MRKKRFNPDSSPRGRGVSRPDENGRGVAYDGCGRLIEYVIKKDDAGRVLSLRAGNLIFIRPKK